MSKTHYHAIWISDIHLGTRDCQTKKLLKFFDETRSDYLYIVGDFLDFWQMYIHHGWSQNCNEFLRQLFRRVKKGTHIKIVPGNHDGLMHVLDSFTFGDIEICREFMHISLSGMRYMVLHGDQYDNFIIKHEKFSRLISKMYNAICGNWISKMLKINVDILTNKSVRCEYKAIEDAKQSGVNGIICGHTHTPKLHVTKNDNILYGNAGDWTMHCTAIVETDDGHINLINHRGEIVEK